MEGKRRKQLNSRQRRKIIENDSFKRHQRQYCMKFSIFEFLRFHGTTPCSTSAPSLQIRFAIWCDQSKAIADKTSGKIRLEQTNSRLSTISGLNTRCAQTRIFHVKLAETPGTGITPIAKRSTNHMVIMQRERRKQWHSRQRREFIENDSFRRHKRQYFMKFSLFEIVSCHGPILGPPQLLRCKLILRLIAHGKPSTMVCVRTACSDRFWKPRTQKTYTEPKHNHNQTSQTSRKHKNEWK